MPFKTVVCETSTKETGFLHLWEKLGMVLQKKKTTVEVIGLCM